MADWCRQEWWLHGWRSWNRLSSSQIWWAGVLRGLGCGVGRLLTSLDSPSIPGEGFSFSGFKWIMQPSLSGRWQAPAAVLPPEGWQRGRGPEGPEDKGHGHSRARRAREWPKHASPRARRARGRAKLSARLGACQCYYMFFTTQLKIAKFMGRFQDLNVDQKSWKLQWIFISAL